MNCNWCGQKTCNIPGPLVRPHWHRSQCTGCGALTYQALPSPDDLAAVYAMAWEEERPSDEFAIGATSEAISCSLLRAAGWQLSAQSKCLDYGGGRGEFSLALINQGCKHVYVYEPFGKMREIGAAKWVKELGDLAGECFDWIFLIEVIEHMRDPISELRKIERLVAPRGKLFVTTPNAKGLRARLDGHKWREAQNPTHINLFSATALERCLREAGFSKATRLYRPVRYNASGIRAIALSIAQYLGVDGGLRYIVEKGDDG